MKFLERFTKKEPPVEEEKELSPIEKHNMYALFEACKRESQDIRLEKNAKGEILAPNGMVSELKDSETLCKIIRTRRFKEWFGDWIAEPEIASRAVYSTTGEPKIYFHGTPSNIYIKEGLDERYSTKWVKEGEICFTDSRKDAVGIAIDRAKDRNQLGEQAVYSAFLNVKRPGGDYIYEGPYRSMTPDGNFSTSKSDGVQWAWIPSKNQVMSLPLSLLDK